MTPQQWAKAAIATHGALKAYQITKTTGREMIGQDGESKNPHHAFFLEAGNIIKKLHAEVAQ